MKVRVEIEEALEEDYVIIHCKRLNEQIMQVQNILTDIGSQDKTILLHRENKEYYLPLDRVLFFETENKEVRVHTKTEIYDTEYKLYELEELLPGYFMRISKSTIVNLNQVYSISRNLTSSSLIEFVNCHKQVYVSRNYYKALIDRLAEKRRKL